MSQKGRIEEETLGPSLYSFSQAVHNYLGAPRVLTHPRHLRVPPKQVSNAWARHELMQGGRCQQGKATKWMTKRRFCPSQRLRVVEFDACHYQHLQVVEFDLCHSQRMRAVDCTFVTAHTCRKWIFTSVANSAAGGRI